MGGPFLVLGDRGSPLSIAVHIILIWGFPKIRGILGSPIKGNYHISYLPRAMKDGWRLRRSCWRPTVRELSAKRWLPKFAGLGSDALKGQKHELTHGSLSFSERIGGCVNMKRRGVHSYGM